jgi:phenylalanyl-tRNA synthetase beta chain
MKISLRWLREYLALNRTADEIADALTFTGVEVERVEHRGVQLDKVIVAQIDAFEPHPNADRLSVCRVADGSGVPRRIVCGAKNFKAGDKVPLALPGAILPDGTKIKTSKVRGVESEGMLCSAKELNLAEDQAGLLILSPDAPIGESISDIFPADTILELEITPDRPDLLCYYGIARELAAIFGLPAPAPITIRTDAGEIQSDPAEVRIEAPDACPFITFRRIRNVQVGPSPEWLRSRLEAAGLRSINNIVDVTNFVMLEMGKPLHTYDLATIEGGIQVRFARPGEELLALDGKKYSLKSDHLVIADQRKPLGLGGVMGGEETGVTERTSAVLLESAYFSASLIRKISRGLDLISDASFRFERGIDPESVIPASLRAVDLILELAGGEVDGALLAAGEKPAAGGIVTLRPERCAGILGTASPDPNLLLPRIGLRSLGENRWQIPSYRLDLNREIDLIEEVCRLSGIQNIEGRVLNRATPSSDVDRQHDELMQTRRLLAGLGLFEARSLTLVGDSAAKESLVPASKLVRLRNPLVEDQQILRPSLVSGLVRAAARNFNRGADSVSLFEIGRVFRPGQNEESTSLGILLSGERLSKTWNQSAVVFNLFDLKGLLQAVAGQEIRFERLDPTSFTALVCQIVSADGTVLGHAGQVRPSLAQELGARGPMVIAELEFRPTAERKSFRFRPLDRFPAVTRDIAFLAPLDLKFSSVLETLRSGKETLLVDVRLFDLFIDPAGEKIPAREKSMACSLTYRSSDRTLTQSEVNAAHQRLKSLLVEKLGVKLRE